MFSQIKDRKHIEQNFHSVARVMPQGWDFGGAGRVKNFSVGICDGARSTARLVEFIKMVGEKRSNARLAKYLISFFCNEVKIQ